jgi:hypothetical protein
VAGIDRFDEMCVGFLSIEIPAYKERSYQSVCGEAQAIADDVCGPGSPLVFTGAPCADDLERWAVLLVTTPPERVHAYWCGPTGADSQNGAKCDLAMNCHFACGYRTGLTPSGILPDCIARCAANVNAETPDATPLAPSPAAGWLFQELATCANRHCTNRTTWQTYDDCMEARCGDLFAACYGL